MVDVIIVSTTTTNQIVVGRLDFSEVNIVLGVSNQQKRQYIAAFHMNMWIKHISYSATRI